jgi:hypothetical protein
MRSLGRPPHFLLRAHDQLAPETIRYWIRLARERGVNARKIAAAMRHLERLMAWQRAHWTKLPD